MHIDKTHILNLTHKVNRTLELAEGRVNYNRTHKDRTKYDRKKIKKELLKCLVD